MKGPVIAWSMRGAGLALGAVVGFLVAAGLPAVGVGGVVVVGAGTGVSWQSTGHVCEDAPFNVQIVYLPGNQAILEFNWAKVVQPGENCWAPVSTGGSTAVGTVSVDLMRVPPVAFQGACVGNEAMGLRCGDFVNVGPSQGSGFSVWLRKTWTDEVFLGTFLSV